jgi:methyl-accepting chemotaxis protein
VRLQAFYDKGIPVLDELLDARIAAMQQRVNLAAMVVGTVLLFGAYFFYSFFLVTRGGLELISKHLKQLAEGDLRTAPAKPLGSDEPSLVIHDMRTAYESLHMLIRQVRHSARALHSASSEISDAATDLSGRTELAASTLGEQASAMTQISETVGATATQAKMAATFAVDNADVAERGGHVFTEVVATMRDIHDSSNKINDIISVIDGIAFQTNILALNAAVEAARAGESGRGFAVVAAEVRSLAGRSASAAREIKSLITVSVEKVRAGTQVVEGAGTTMTEVVTNARQINQFLSEISDAARAQAVGVDKVGQAIQQLDTNTQQNAALVEETMAAAGALSQQADTLQEEIANFKVA